MLDCGRGHLGPAVRHRARSAAGCPSSWARPRASSACSIPWRHPWAAACLAYGAIMGASIIGGLFEAVLGFFLKPLRRFFPAVVTGTVALSIGLVASSASALNTVRRRRRRQGLTATAEESAAWRLAVLVVVLAVRARDRRAFERIHPSCSASSSACARCAVSCRMVLPVHRRRRDRASSTPRRGCSNRDKVAAGRHGSPCRSPAARAARVRRACHRPRAR